VAGMTNVEILTKLERQMSKERQNHKTRKAAHFAFRLLNFLRGKNKTGFVCRYSEYPEGFVRGS
jgi:hypothetical protein